MLGTIVPTVPARYPENVLREMTGEVSVRPYPSKTRTPTSRNHSVVSLPSGAPPEMNTFARPPNASAILLNASLFASAQRSPDGRCPAATLARCLAPCFIAH